jgi:putative transposase
MARLARLSIGGYPHLVVQHAGARAVVSDDDDADQLLGVLRAAAAEADVGLHGYALLPQGLWLLATPADAHGLGRAMQSIGRRFVRWVNDRRREKGGLFDGRYRAALLEPETELLLALRYIESQPVLAGVAATPEESRWSSCRHHVGLATDPWLADHPVYWALGNTPFERQAAYRIFLHQGVSVDEATRLERALTGGWVLGSKVFVKQIAPLCSRRPERSQAGRPRSSSRSPVSTGA